MTIRDAELACVCGVTSRLPETGLPEFAFAGKSNVGKSSLINCLLNRKALARTSSQPGKTQTINYYRINREFYLVDLPGYGYAKVALEARAAWGRMIERYLHTSENLKQVFLLVDIRHAPSENDVMMYEWIRNSGRQPVVIATKLDKIKRSQTGRQLRLIRETLGAGPEEAVIPFSAQTRQGREEIWKVIGDALGENGAENGVEEHGNHSGGQTGL